MRYNDRITFVTEGSIGYNPETGQNEQTEPIKKTIPCNLSELGITRTYELFGDIDTRIIVARTQRPYKGTFDYVMIDGVRYNAKRQSMYRRGVFYLESTLEN